MHNVLGTFNITSIHGPAPFAVRLHTKASVDSPSAKELLMAFARSQFGSGEITDITVGPDEREGHNYLVIEFSDAVLTQDDAKELTRVFITCINRFGDRLEEFGGIEALEYEQAQARGDARTLAAMAVPAKGSGGLSSRYGMTDS